jgi:hypothetical protein
MSDEATRATAMGRRTFLRRATVATTAAAAAGGLALTAAQKIFDREYAAWFRRGTVSRSPCDVR